MKARTTCQEEDLVGIETKNDRDEAAEGLRSRNLREPWNYYSGEGMKEIYVANAIGV